MDRHFQWYKYIKYILIPIFISKFFHFGIPNMQPLFIIEYALLFGVSFLLIILQDFFTISKNKYPTAFHYADYFTAFIHYRYCLSSDDDYYFSILLLGASGFALYLHKKMKENNKWYMKIIVSDYFQSSVGSMFCLPFSYSKLFVGSWLSVWGSYLKGLSSTNPWAGFDSSRYREYGYRMDAQSLYVK